MQAHQERYEKGLEEKESARKLRMQEHENRKKALEDMGHYFNF